MRLRHHLFAVLVILATGSAALALRHPVSAVCTTDPSTAFPGENVSVHVIPTGFIPDRVLTYSFTSTGGGITSNSTANATVVTDGLEPGVYDISSLVSDDHNRKHRLYATCQAAFSIKELPKHPPLMSLRVAPQAVTSGESVTVTAESYSKDNRPVHVNCVTTKGALSGGNNLYVLNTAGVPGGIVDITCTAQDDRDLSGFADAKVMVTVPPPPPPPPAREYGDGLFFGQDKRRPTRVDNVAKGLLDRYADALTADPEAKGVVVGYDKADERMPKIHEHEAPQFAALRAVNSKAYLVEEKGIDPRRIEVRTVRDGTESKVILWIVPPGAKLSASNAESVDELQVRAVPRTEKHVARRRAKRATTHAAVKAVSHAVKTAELAKPEAK